MKDSLRKAFSGILSSNLIWLLCSPIIKLATALQFLRNYRIQQTERDRILAILQKPIVKHGPFEGMVYPSFFATNSALYPKIMGCYEREIHPWIQQANTKKYSEILNIGCAEGYYAVGMAMHVKEAKIYAYDTSPVARESCMSLAKLNKVADRMIIGATCLPETLGQFPFSGKGMILCDCEGYEKVLFNKTNLSNLGNCDILVEIHDFIDPEISVYIRTLFESSHNITSIMSIDDLVKARSYSYPETDSLDIYTRRAIFAETRGGQMEWLWLEAKP